MPQPLALQTSYSVLTTVFSAISAIIFTEFDDIPKKSARPLRQFPGPSSCSLPALWVLRQQGEGLGRRRYSPNISGKVSKWSCPFFFSCLHDCHLNYDIKRRNLRVALPGRRSLASDGTALYGLRLLAAHIQPAGPLLRSSLAAFIACFSVSYLTPWTR